MARFRRLTTWGLLIAASGITSGCQLAPMNGGMFSGLMTSQHDRKIANHAEKSNFPTPDQVGLGKRASTLDR